MKVLLLIDLINEMVDPAGKLAGKGYAEFVSSHGTANALVEWLERDDIDRVVHIGLQFDTDYSNAARNSPLLGKAPDFGVAKAGEFGSEFASWATPRADDIVLRKSRISAFFGTDLDGILKGMGATEIVIGGCATDLAVSSAARDAHDRDYVVSIAPALCVAASEADHDAAMLHLVKIASII